MRIWQAHLSSAAPACFVPACPQFEFIDTPGLQAAASKQAENRAALKGIRAAYRWHKPNYVLWVDRLDAVRPSLGDLSLLGLVNEALGTKVSAGSGEGAGQGGKGSVGGRRHGKDGAR